MNVSLFSAAALVSAADDAKLRTLHSRPSFVFATKEVEVAVTRLGGHMALVTFFRDSAQPVQPYHISPWQDEKRATMPAPVLLALRGDFFCLPFGGNSDEVAGEKHPPHGEIVGERWKRPLLRATICAGAMSIGWPPRGPRNRDARGEGKGLARIQWQPA